MLVVDFQSHRPRHRTQARGGVAPGRRRTESVASVEGEQGEQGEQGRRCSAPRTFWIAKHRILMDLVQARTMLHNALVKG